MATKQRTSSPNYFGNLKTSDANLSGGANVNIFNATAKGARSTGINLGPKGPTQAEKEKAQSDAVVAHNLENSPQINWSQFQNIPNSLQQNIMSIVKEKAAERGYLTHLTKRSGATDFIGKSEIASQINSNEDLIMNHIPGQLEKFSAILDGFPEDAYNNNFSVMNDPKDVTFNSNLSAGKGEYSIDENFNILVDGKSVNEIKPLEPINYEMGSQMLKTFTSAYDNGVALSKNELGLASTNFKMALNKGGTGALLSTAFDDTMSMNGTLLNQDDYQNEIAAIRGDDPDAKMQAIEKIKLAVTDAYLEKLTQQANDGVAFKQSKNNPTITTSGDPSNIPLNNIPLSSAADYFLNQHDYGENALSFEGDGSLSARSFGDEPATSDLGLYLQNNNILLEKTPSTGNTYVMDGLEMDKNDFLVNVKQQAELESTDKKDSNGKRFKNKFEYIRSLPDIQKIELMKEYADEIKEGISGGFTLRPLKLSGDNTGERKKLNRIKFDINDTNSFQRAINKLSKLN